ncbi:MAG: AlpA family phage regulatory protein [bacterium]|nr:AlpA family phage regulatory protein [bacterium]
MGTTNTNNHGPKRRRLNINGVEERIGVHRQTIWHWYKAGSFPPPHYLGQSRLWFEDEIEAWEKAQIKKRADDKNSAA